MKIIKKGEITFGCKIIQGKTGIEVHAFLPITSEAGERTVIAAKHDFLKHELTDKHKRELALSIEDSLKEYAKRPSENIYGLLK